MTGLVFKLYATGPMRLVGASNVYGAAVDTARELARLYQWHVEVWATDTGGRGIRVHRVYQCG